MSNSVEQSWQQNNYENLIDEISLLKVVLRSRQNKKPEKTVASLNQPVRVFRRAKEFGERSQNTSNDTATLSDSTHQMNIQRLLLNDTRATKNSSVMLNNLCQLFGLSLLERKLLVLCVGMELDTEVPVLCAELSQLPYPSISLMLSILGGHCAMLAPDSALRYFSLVDVKYDNNSFVRQNISITPWALFYLTGAPTIDSMLSSSLHPINALQPYLKSQLESSFTLQQTWLVHDEQESVTSAVQLISPDIDDRRQILALAAQQRPVYEFNLYHVPLSADEQNSYRRLIEREVLAQQCLLLIDCQRLLAGGEPEVDLLPIRNWLDCLLCDLPNVCVLSSNQEIELPLTRVHYQYLPVLQQDEQLKLWQHCLTPSASDDGIDNTVENDISSDMEQTLEQLSIQFNLSNRQVRTVAHTVRDKISNPEALRKHLWQGCRDQSRQQLQGLAHVISPQELDWNDLVLPSAEKETLLSIVMQVKQRQQVYQHWGFANKVSYGLGISALFAGSSGTGKTMAARMIASQLQLDLYHVDLSCIVDKYIGETEKNLDKIFQAAEDSGAVLLFDEADALFGKRTKVQDSKDRHANMGVSFLLQRMEKYNGLSILTTNLRGAMDDAFLRRLRFIISFPFPQQQERQKIWQSIIPVNMPTVDIDYEKLARLTLAGGSVRNIVLQAAFIAAKNDDCLTMGYLREAVRQEYLKAEKTLDEKLIKDW